MELPFILISTEITVIFHFKPDDGLQLDRKYNSISILLGFLKLKDDVFYQMYQWGVIIIDFFRVNCPFISNINCT